MAEEWSCETCAHKGTLISCTWPSSCKDGEYWEPKPAQEPETKQEPQILDSGERREFETGAVRDIQEGKGRCDLLPLRQVAELLVNINYLSDPLIIAIDNYQKTKSTVELHKAIKEFANRLGWSIEKAILEVSKHFEAGCQKYGERNWEKGIPEHCYIDSAIRHYLKWRDGWTDEPHDRAVLWNLICLWWTHENITTKKSEEE